MEPVAAKPIANRVAQSLSVVPPCSLETPDALPSRVRLYPQLRFMGSKHRLLPWIHEVLRPLRFDTALDAFSGSGCVSYLLKSLGKEVTSNDFLKFPAAISKAAIQNQKVTLSPETVSRLLENDKRRERFIEKTFTGVFFTPRDLRFLDRISWNLRRLRNPYARSLALAALMRSCVKRQPRGVFTVSGDPQRYNDGRRDMKLSLEEHFIEQVEVYNRCVFDNGRRNLSLNRGVFDLTPDGYDLVYLDPPYVPRSDDNCYVKRYHFLEGLACYWKGLEILEETKVKKIRKLFTPFSYRRTAIEAFDALFKRFRKSILVLSYSSNGYPDLRILTGLMKGYKSNVEVHERGHRYHFGTHDAVKRSVVQEYLIVGS